MCNQGDADSKKSCEEKSHWDNVKVEILESEWIESFISVFQ